MRKLEVRLDWGSERQVVGSLAEDAGRVYFEYDAGFLASGLALSPFKLPLRPGLFEHADREFAAVFGVFNDSLPDGWGLLLMDREFRKRGIQPATLTPLDRLAYIGTRGMGALTYHPPAEPGAEQTFSIDLAELAEQAERIIEGSPEDVLPALRIAGGSPAGARPKVLVGVHPDGRLIAGTSALPAGYRHFLVKFAASEDLPDIGPVEAAYARMARAAGLNVPDTRVFQTADGGRYFGAERFDRYGNRRIHMHTLSGLLHASHRLPSLDYEGLLRATRALTKDERQVAEAFRRMAFNVLARNRDDHVKNFSFLMQRTGEWKLAPAYDVVFSDGPGGHHTMAVAGETARPAAADMLRVAETCALPLGAARSIIGEVGDAVRDWPRFARETGVSPESEQLIGEALNAIRAG